MSYTNFTILIGGITHTIQRIHNSNFELASKMFALFSDDNFDNHLILKFDEDHPEFTIKFYLNPTHECIFDTFMMVCFFNRIEAFNLLIKNQRNIKKLHYNYTFGTGTSTTPSHVLSCGNKKVK